MAPPVLTLTKRPLASFPLKCSDTLPCSDLLPCSETGLTVNTPGVLTLTANP